MAGHQTQAVCGEQTPYLSVPYKYLAEKKPTLFTMLMNAIERMWAKAKGVFPVECANMMQIRPALRLGNTGFHKISTGTNLNALWHKDSGNLKNSIQCVLVLGAFVGGEVRFDVAGRVGKNRSENTKSKGREEDVVVVPNQHGTLFIGHYERLWHAVNAVTDGNRTIIAAYAGQKVADFDRAIRGRYTFEQALELRRYRVNAVKWMALSEPDLKKREIVRNGHTSAWKARDLAIKQDHWLVKAEEACCAYEASLERVATKRKHQCQSSPETKRPRIE